MSVDENMTKIRRKLFEPQYTKDSEIEASLHGAQAEYMRRPQRVCYRVIQADRGNAAGAQAGHRL